MRDEEKQCGGPFCWKAKHKDDSSWDSWAASAENSTGVKDSIFKGLNEAFKSVGDS